MTLADRSGTALLVIDVQHGVVEAAHERDRVVATIADLVERARAAEVPVVWVQHSDAELKRGSEAWEYVPELRRRDAEPLLDKHYGNAFEGTDLEAVLAERGVGRLVVMGAATDWCIRSTLHGAFTRGYDVTLVADAHTTVDLTEHGAPPPAQVIAHTNLYWDEQLAPGRRGRTVVAAQIDFRTGRRHRAGRDRTAETPRGP